MIVGFTGTREGTTAAQHDGLRELLRVGLPDAIKFHHGDCVGADADFHELVGELCQGRRAVIHLRPCDISRMRAWCSPPGGDISVVEHDPKRPLDRNKDIVDACDLLLACPKGPEERQSGTWSTIRYAMRRGKPVIIIFPDGTLSDG